jgi:hypothetical protein
VQDWLSYRVDRAGIARLAAGQPLSRAGPGAT